MVREEASSGSAVKERDEDESVPSEAGNVALAVLGRDAALSAVDDVSEDGGSQHHRNNSLSSCNRKDRWESECEALVLEPSTGVVAK